MKLLDVVNGIDYKIFGNIDVIVKSIEIDSRKVEKGSMFVCLKGNLDGNDFIVDAINNGATVIVTDNVKLCNNDATFVIVDNTRKAYSIFSNNFFENPNKKLKMIAITGTNGKTSTSYIIESVLKTANKNVGVIGTLGAKFNNTKIDTNLTTPDSFTLNKILNLMVNAGVEYVVMEVSSHSIFYYKTFGIVFDYAIFTNFSQDHLDFFNNMYNYALTKLSFFSTNDVKVAIVNSDDIVGRAILINNPNIIEEKYSKDVTSFFSIKDYLKQSKEYKTLQKFSYGIDNPSDVFAIDINYDKKISFIVNAFDKIYEVKSNLIGKHNVYNILAGITLLEAMGISEVDIVKGINNLQQIEGRLNIINYKNNQIVIDFAHSEDGLENLLNTVKGFAKGKIITVFGCGGNRDKNKRAHMGEVASKYSDLIILTSDNPRYENPIDIVNDIKKGIKDKYIVIIDRFEAIKCGIGMLKDNDVLVIAGRGGETKQEIAGRLIDFDDKEVVHKILRKIN